MKRGRGGGKEKGDGVPSKFVHFLLSPDPVGEGK